MKPYPYYIDCPHCYREIDFEEINEFDEFDFAEQLMSSPTEHGLSVEKFIDDELLRLPNISDIEKGEG